MGFLGLANFLRLPAKAQNLSFSVFSFTANWFHHLYVFLELIFFILCGSIRVVVCRHWGKNFGVFLFCFFHSQALVDDDHQSLYYFFVFFLVCLFVCSVSVFTVICCWSLTSFKTEEKKSAIQKNILTASFLFVC